MTTVEQSRALRSIVDVWQDVCWDLRDKAVPFPKAVHSCLIDLERAVHNGTDINAAIDAVEKAAREAGIWTRPNGPTAHLKYGQTYVLEDTPFANAVNALRAVTPQLPTARAAHAVRVPSDAPHLNLALGEARDQRDEARRERDEAQQLAQDFERRADDNAAELNDIQCIVARTLGCEVPQTGANPALELARRLAAELAQVQAAVLQALGRTVPQIGANPTLTVVNDLIIALRAERAGNRGTVRTAPEVNETRDPQKPTWEKAREAWRTMRALYCESPAKRRTSDLYGAVSGCEASIYRGERGWIDAAKDTRAAIDSLEQSAKDAGLWEHTPVDFCALPLIDPDAYLTPFAQSILALRAATPRE